MSRVIEYSNQEIPKLLELLSSTVLEEQDEHHLTIYLSTKPQDRRGPDANQIWQIELKHKLQEQLECWAKEDREIWRQLDLRLKEIQDTIDLLCDPHGAGTGKVLFTSLNRRADIHLLRTQMDVETTVHVNSRASFGPLLTLTREGRESGALLISEKDAQFWRICMGEAEMVKCVNYKEMATEADKEEATDDMTLPALGADEWTGMDYEDSRNSTMSQYHSRAKGIPEGRLAEHRKQFIQVIAKMLPDALSGDRLILAGDPRDLNYLKEHQTWKDQTAVCEINQHLNGLSDADRLSRLNECLVDLNEQQEKELVVAARDNALSGGKGAIGLDDVFTALAEHRASVVVFDPQCKYSGFINQENGALLTQKNGHKNVIVEDDLREHIWRACKQSGAELVPIEGAAAHDMQEHDGIAAILYW